MTVAFVLPLKLLWLLKSIYDSGLILLWLLISIYYSGFCVAIEAAVVAAVYL